MNIISEIEATGFVLIKGYLPEETTQVAVAHIGTCVKLPGIASVQVLKPRGSADATPNVYSGNFGYEAFPLHTDLAHWCIPPHYIVLRCVSGATEVATYLADGKQLIAAFGEPLLGRALVQPRRPVGLRRPLLRLLDKRGSSSSFLRWDSLFIQPSTPASVETYRAIGAFLAGMQQTQIALEAPGDTLIIDNWRTLHGRSQVPKGAYHRQIERVYLGALH